jgi:hypothetical protein
LTKKQGYALTWAMLNKLPNPLEIVVKEFPGSYQEMGKCKAIMQSMSNGVFPLVIETEGFEQKIDPVRVWSDYFKFVSNLLVGNDRKTFEQDMKQCKPKTADDFSDESEDEEDSEWDNATFTRDIL